MKKILFFLISVLLFSCDKDNQVNNNNPFLPNLNFSISINTSLPTYSSLQFASNSVKVDIPGAGARGIIVFNTGSGYVAYDGACPNQDLSSCSTLTLNGITATCPCDSAEYNLFTGQSPGKQYPLKPYTVSASGTNITISN